MRSSNSSADVVIVGGGIVGCLCAYFAAKAGLSVVLLERDVIAGATSGSCMGHLMVVPKPAPMHALTRASVRLWRDLARELGTIELHDTGALWLAEDATDMALLDELAHKFADQGAPGELLDARGLREREPGLAPDLPGAFFFAEDAVLMPMLATGAVLRAAIARGVEVRTHTPVHGVRRDPNGAVAAVRTAAGDIATRHVIDAAGVWAPAVAATAGIDGVPVHPRRGDLAITMARETPVRSQLLEVGYLRTTTTASADPTSGAPDPGAQALNVQPQTHGTCLIGSTRQFAGMHRTVDRALLHRSLARAARFVPGLRGARIVRTWAGLRPYSIDQLPLIGPVPGAAGFWLATGHEGLGITLAPITGLLLAQQLTGAIPVLDGTPFAPARFAVAIAR